MVYYRILLLFFFVSVSFFTANSSEATTLTIKFTIEDIEFGDDNADQSFEWTDGTNYHWYNYAWSIDDTFILSLSYDPNTILARPDFYSIFSPATLLFSEYQDNSGFDDFDVTNLAYFSEWRHPSKEALSYRKYSSGKKIREINLGSLTSHDEWEGSFHFSDPCGNTVELEVEGAVVPEPSTLILLGSGLAGLAWYRRKKK